MTFESDKKAGSSEPAFFCAAWLRLRLDILARLIKDIYANAASRPFGVVRDVGFLWPRA
jgi:hypothetical protein